jgi:hypothetical protein
LDGFARPDVAFGTAVILGLDPFGSVLEFAIAALVDGAA